MFVSASALNRLHIHNKCTRVHCPRMLVWCSLLLLVAIKAINVCAVHANFSWKCLQTREIFKNTYSIGVTKYTCVICAASSLNQAVPYFMAYLRTCTYKTIYTQSCESGHFPWQLEIINAPSESFG